MQAGNSLLEHSVVKLKLVPVSEAPWGNKTNEIKILWLVSGMNNAFLLCLLLHEPFSQL